MPFKIATYTRLGKEKILWICVWRFLTTLGLKGIKYIIIICGKRYKLRNPEIGSYSQWLTNSSNYVSICVPWVLKQWSNTGARACALAVAYELNIITWCTTGIMHWFPLVVASSMGDKDNLHILPDAPLLTHPPSCDVFLAPSTIPGSACIHEHKKAKPISFYVLCVGCYWSIE